MLNREYAEYLGKEKLALPQEFRRAAGGPKGFYSSGELTVVRAATQGVPLTLRTDDLPPDELIFGRSAVMQEFRQKIPKFAATNVPLLIQGESGTGKGGLARYIHSRAKFAAGPVVNVNCAALPGTLLQRERVGHGLRAVTSRRARVPGP